MPDLSVAEVTMEIPFHDVDSYRVVWHGNYARYFEIARCRLLDQLNISYPQMEAMGFFFPVIEMKAKYLKSLSFGQKITITARLLEWRHKLIIKYFICDANSGDLLTKGQTSQVAVSRDGVLQFDAPTPLITAIEQAISIP